MRTDKIRLDVAFWALLILSNVQEGYSAYVSLVFAGIVGVFSILREFISKED